ncbi:DNA polymerase III subunit alpha, partial [Candidatus Nomurabacteria bacterium]|nr:DNA polymerase III subunit alpha [Candidatus Nomurabacteria bacterium]
MSAKYVHLHTHSHYSLLNALPKIPDLIKAAKKEGMTALALTDNGSLYGAIEFYKECKKEDIKPIIGIDGFMAARKRTDKEGRVDSERTRIILLAKNRNGYKNLIKLVTLSHLEGFYYKPRMDREILEKYHEDLICISPSFTGDVVTALKNKNREKAIEVTEYYKTLFKDFYIEITHHPEIENHEKNMELLKKFADEMNVPIVAGHDVYYLKKEDKKARDTLVAIQKNFSLRDLNADTGDFHFISNENFESLFKNEPEAIHNTRKIAEMCNLDIELGKWVFPNFQIPENSDYDNELRKMVVDGLKNRKMEETKEVKDRIEYELGIIKNKGYAPYFLVVGDLINFAHKNKILTTIRGSVAGSLVTYLVGITNVNPLEYKLPFERFLNPERPSAPDIDMDFADNRRDEMIAYAKEKYGADKVAQIGTFGTMMAR